MIPQTLKLKEQSAGVISAVSTAAALTSYWLTNEDNSGVLDFLAERPIHNVVMSGFIRDNGLESWLNRGTFYACHNEAGKLEGVALIGHAMFLDARTDDALEVFARLAQDVRSTHMIMGEQETIQRFWNYYSAGGQAPRLFGREVLFEQASPVDTFAPVPGLRPANLDDLSLIVPVHATMAYEESGVNPADRKLPQGDEGQASAGASHDERHRDDDLFAVVIIGDMAGGQSKQNHRDHLGQPDQAEI